VEVGLNGVPRLRERHRVVGDLIFASFCHPGFQFILWQPPTNPRFFLLLRAPPLLHLTLALQLCSRTGWTHSCGAGFGTGTWGLGGCDPLDFVELGVCLGAGGTSIKSKMDTGIPLYRIPGNMGSSLFDFEVSLICSRDRRVTRYVSWICCCAPGVRAGATSGPEPRRPQCWGLMILMFN